MCVFDGAHSFISSIASDPMSLAGTGKTSPYDVSCVNLLTRMLMKAETL